jgi:Kef-type K+ transport system membrane component KefB
MSDVAGPASITLLLGILFLIGLAADLLGRYTFLPRVTLLMLCGLAIGRSGFAVLPADFIANWFPPLTSIALALLGFLLGQQLSLPALRQRGGIVIRISLCKVLGAWLTVGAVLLLAGAPPLLAVLLAGIAPATEPAATYDVVHESGARNEFTETLLSIVAIDDVWGMLIFVLMMGVASVITVGGAGAGAIAEFGAAGGSILLGVALGTPMAYLSGRIRPGEPTLAEALGFILLNAGCAEWLGLLPILSAMVMGITVASLAKHHDRPFHAIQGIEWPFMILFFVLAGASLEIGELLVTGGLTVAYILARCVGIYAGAAFGSGLVHRTRTMQKWLGLALFPQAGVALGMALVAAQRYPEMAAGILTIVVTSTIVLETVGPVFARIAIHAAAEK